MRDAQAWRYGADEVRAEAERDARAWEEGMANEYSEPWGFGDRERPTVCTAGGDGTVVHRPDRTRDDQFSAEELERIILCVNAFAGVLNEAIDPATPKSDEYQLALAVLRGECGAIEGLLDRLMERRLPPPTCEHPDCDGRPGTYRAYSPRLKRVVRCCEPHGEAFADEDRPEYLHECENCRCLLPIN